MKTIRQITVLTLVQFLGQMWAIGNPVCGQSTPMPLDQVGLKRSLLLMRSGISPYTTVYLERIDSAKCEEIGRAFQVPRKEIQRFRWSPTAISTNRVENTDFIGRVRDVFFERESVSLNERIVVYSIWYGKKVRQIKSIIVKESSETPAAAILKPMLRIKPVHQMPRRGGAPILAIDEQVIVAPGDKVRVTTGPLSTVGLFEAEENGAFLLKPTSRDTLIAVSSTPETILELSEWGVGRRLERGIYGSGIGFLLGGAATALVVAVKIAIGEDEVGGWLIRDEDFNDPKWILPFFELGGLPSAGVGGIVGASSSPGSPRQGAIFGLLAGLGSSALFFRYCNDASFRSVWRWGIPVGGVVGGLAGALTNKRLGPVWKRIPLPLTISHVWPGGGPTGSPAETTK